MSIKIRELASRQRRLDALNEAAQKLDVVRTLMRTRGSHAVPKKQVADIKNAVGQTSARITSHGLAVSNADDDEDDETNRSKIKYYKWSNERKK